MLGSAAWRMVATNDLPCRNRRAPWTAHRWTVQCHIPLWPHNSVGGTGGVNYPWRRRIRPKVV